MSFTTPSEKDISHFIEVLGIHSVIIDHRKQDYAHDETEDLVFVPEVVLIPENTHQISLILKYCNEKGIAVTPRGGGTGLSGGALPIYGGVLISMHKFNKIITIDENNLQVIVDIRMRNNIRGLFKTAKNVPLFPNLLICMVASMIHI